MFTMEDLVDFFFLFTAVSSCAQPAVSTALVSQMVSQSLQYPNP